MGKILCIEFQVSCFGSLVVAGRAVLIDDVLRLWRKEHSGRRASLDTACGQAQRERARRNRKTFKVSL
jgi:hypothetical protein